MTRALVLTALLAPAIAHANTWETKAQGAVAVERHDDLVWALTAACDKGDDTQQRQCRIVRDRKAKTLAGTVWVKGDPDAVVAGAWNAQKKSVPVTIRGCVLCLPVDVDGTPWSIVDTKARLESGMLRGGILYDNARPFPDEAAAAAWVKRFAGARFELLVRAGPKSRVVIGGHHALAVDVVAWRVVDICDGSILLSSVPSSGGNPDKAVCRALAAKSGGGGAPPPPTPELPAQLSTTMIRNAMRPLQAAARACAVKAKVSGRIKLELQISSDGTIVKHEQTGDLAGTPAGKCIDDAVKSVVFPKTKRPLTKVRYPLVLP